MLIANLAVSDMLVCASNVASTWVSFFHDRAFFLRNPRLCVGNGLICGIGCLCSMACICTIAMNRLYLFCIQSTLLRVVFTFSHFLLFFDTARESIRNCLIVQSLYRTSNNNKYYIYFFSMSGQKPSVCPDFMPIVGFSNLSLGRCR